MFSHSKPFLINEDYLAIQNVLQSKMIAEGENEVRAKTSLLPHEDLNIDIFVETKDLPSVDEEVSRLVFDLTKETDFLILPTVSSMESCPVK